ncbi:MAG: shikimate kinase [Candidatus Altiarchaeota archaeon]
MKASSKCNGAATIITAFATGRGGAYGIGLENRTTVEFDDSNSVRSIVNGEESVGVELAEAAVKRALARFNVDFTGANVVTETDIPVAAGLKSSSVAANAIVLATVGVIAKERGDVCRKRLSKTRDEQEIIIDGKAISPIEIINIGVDAAFDAKVTVTGALDDASASYLGGYTLTENDKRRVVYHGGMEETLNVLIHLPERKIHTGGIKTEQVRGFAKEIDMLWENARSGRIYQAITLNGLIHSTAFRLNPEPTLLALETGAIAAGLSGTGPATVALVREDSGALKDSWKGLGGRVIETRTNNARAEIIG